MRTANQPKERSMSVDHCQKLIELCKAELEAARAAGLVDWAKSHEGRLWNLSKLLHSLQREEQKIAFPVS